MFEQTLPRTTRHYLDLLARKEISTAFYLGGGAAVALHLGHRISVDLDFFTPDPFEVNGLENQLQDFKTYRRDQLSKDTLLGALGGLRISFFRYRYKLLEPPSVFLGTKILQLPDLAAMKIEAVAQRNTKRDFIDLYFLAHEANIPPAKALDYHREKYAGLNINASHLVLSLGVFDEADEDPMPQMLKVVNWSDVKKYFRAESKALMKKLIG